MDATVDVVHVVGGSLVVVVVDGLGVVVGAGVGSAAALCLKK